MVRTSIQRTVSRSWTQAPRPSMAAVAALFLAAFSAGESRALAQSDTFDLASFAAPAGWRVSQSQTAKTYTTTDEVARTYCMLGIYVSTPSSGSLARDFAADWNAIVRNGFDAGAAPAPSSGETASGLPYLEGGGNVRQQGTSGYAHLMVFSAGARSFSVLLVATDRAELANRQAAIGSFLNSLRVTAGGARASVPAIPAPGDPVTPGRSPGPVSGLTYNVPSGWNRTEVNGLVTLVRVVDLGFGLKNDFRLISLAPERSTGRPVDSFNAIWNRLMGDVFVTSMHPLPVRVRLRTGAVLLYDGDTMRLRQNNTEVTGFLYAVIDGDSVAPFVGVFTGWDQPLDAALRQFFDSVRVPGGGGQKEALFSRPELVGVWRASSTSLANWVDAAGNYRGDATVATGETLALRADGTYQSQFAAVGGGRTIRQNDTGTFDIEDDMLVLRRSTPDQRITRYRVTGVGRSADGRGSFLLLGVTRDDFPDLSGGSTMPRAGNLYVGMR